MRKKYAGTRFVPTVKTTNTSFAILSIRIGKESYIRRA